MKRMKALPLAALLALAFLKGAAAADTFSILSFDNGYAPGYNLATGNLAVASRFALNVQIAEPLMASFVFIDGDNTILPDYRMLRLGYQLIDRLRLCVALGSVTGASTAPALAIGTFVSGIGFDTVAFRRKFQEALATEFKVQVEYLFAPTVPAASMTGGILFLGLAFSIGM
jgi:hypothetical protein